MEVSVQFSRSVMFDSLQPHGLQHARPPCSSPTPRVYSNSCPSSRCCHPTISSSVVPFSSCLQSFPTSGSFPMSQFFASGGQSIGASASASASVLPINIRDWSPLGWTGWISLQSKGLSRVFSNTTVQKHQCAWPSACLFINACWLTLKEKTGDLANGIANMSAWVSKEKRTCKIARIFFYKKLANKWEKEETSSWKRNFRLLIFR